jgi:hypothetical protein
MGVCERLVLFEHRYGSRRSAQQRAAMAQVTASTVVFSGGAVGAQGALLIATLVFGEGAEVTTRLMFETGCCVAHRSVEGSSWLLPNGTGRLPPPGTFVLGAGHAGVAQACGVGAGKILADRGLSDG